METTSERLPASVKPDHYDITLMVDPEVGQFSGRPSLMSAFTNQPS